MMNLHSVGVPQGEARPTGRTRISVERRWFRRVGVVVEIEFEQKLEYRTVVQREGEGRCVVSKWWRPLSPGDLHGRLLTLETLPR